MDWLYKISLTCFAASYLVVFALEVSRVFFDAGLRKYLRIGFAAAGLFAHTVYLFYQGKLEFDSTGIWLSSWFGWCLATAWILAAAYLWISIRQSKSVMGLFLQPVILALIGVGSQFGSQDVFSVGRAKTIWNMVHGSALLLGTAIVALGFVFGLVYLIQAGRLKRKVVPSSNFRLPSLEWLQRSCEIALVTSTLFLAAGLVSGIALNLINRAADSNLTTRGTVEWSDPVVWSSAVLFLWLLASAVFNACYRPARQGRKVAYLVVTSFLFLVLELGIVWWVGHAVGEPTEVVNGGPIVSIGYERCEPTALAAGTWSGEFKLEAPEARPRLLDVSGKALDTGKSRKEPAASALPLTTEYPAKSNLIYKTPPSAIGSVCAVKLDEMLINMEALS